MAESETPPPPPLQPLPPPQQRSRVRPHHALAVAVLLVGVGLLLRYDWAPGQPGHSDAGGAAPTAPGAASPAAAGIGGLSDRMVPVQHPAGVDSVSPYMPPWDLARFQAALASVGIGSLPVAGPVHQHFMTVSGTVLQLARQGNPLGTAQIYIYGDAVTRGHDTDRLDSARVGPSAAAVHWEGPATLLTSNNLAVILLANEPATAALVRKAVESEPRPATPNP